MEMLESMVLWNEFYALIVAPARLKALHNDEHGFSMTDYLFQNTKDPVGNPVHAYMM